MFDAEALKELKTGGDEIRYANEAITEALGKFEKLVVLPDGFRIEDLEQFMPERDRMRGQMSTSSMLSFAAYVTAHRETGTTVFISDQTMSATAVLNLGYKDNPGHADNSAQFTPKMTAEFRALHVACTSAHEQSKAAEFLEDYSDCIKCYNGDVELANKPAISALRSITVEKLGKVQTVEEEPLGSSRSAFESINTKGAELLPTTMVFTCRTYTDLAPRDIRLRVSINAKTDKPMVSFRIIAPDSITQAIAVEMVEAVERSLTGTGIQVLIGDYRRLP